MCCGYCFVKEGRVGAGSPAGSRNNIRGRGLFGGNGFIVHSVRSSSWRSEFQNLSEICQHIAIRLPSSIWLSRGYCFVNLRNPMFSRTFIDVVCDAVVKEGAQSLRVFPARHQGIDELRAHHRAQMQERSNRVYSRMPPVFM